MKPISANISINPTLNKVASSQEKISSGEKINSAKDDAAGLQISNKLLTQLNSLENQTRNANDAVSYYQVADAGLSGVQDAAQRINELSIQAANGTLGSSERQAIQQEIQGLQEQVGTIATDTQFAGQAVFGNSSNTLSNSIALDSEMLVKAVSEIDVTSAAGAQKAIAQSEVVLEQVGAGRTSIGALQNQLLSDIEVQQSSRQANSQSYSRIKDTDIAAEVSEQVKNKMQLETMLALKAQGNLEAGLLQKLL